MIYTAIIAFMNFSSDKNAARVLLLILVFIEVGYLNSKTLQQRVVMTSAEGMQKIGYNDYSVEASAYLKTIDKGFFRVNKDYASGPAIHTSSNDAKMQDYFGTLSYTSFNQKYYIRFLEETECIKKGEEFQTRWAPGFETRPFLQSFGSVKYNFVKNKNSPFLQYGFDSLTQIGDVKILRNRYALPLGFTYDRCMPLKEYQKLSQIQKQLVLFKTFIAEEPVSPQFAKFSTFGIADTSKNYSWGELAADVNARKADSVQLTGFSNKKINASVTLKSAKLVFFTIPYDKGWHGMIDGRPAEPILCNVGFIGLYLEQGKHDIELFYKPPWYAFSLAASLIGLLIYLALAGVQLASNRKRMKING